MSIELIFVEEQQTTVAARVRGVNPPGRRGGPRDAHVDDTVPLCLCDPLRQKDREILVHR